MWVRRGAVSLILNLSTSWLLVVASRIIVFDGSLVSDMGHLKSGRGRLVEEEGIPRKSGMVTITSFLFYRFSEF
jgi:hypothetical protein